MKVKLFTVSAIAAGLIMASCGTGSFNGKLETGEDSLSYAFGIINYYGLRSMDSTLVLDPAFVAAGMADSESGKAKMSDMDAEGYFIVAMNMRRQAQQQAAMDAYRAEHKEYIEQQEKFLADNKTKPGVTTTASGLQYEVIKMGNGPKPTMANSVKAHYVGTLIDGTEFDSSLKNNQPVEFAVQGVIPGWTEALQLMPTGSKFKLYVPENLGYGAQARGDIIKPYSALIFEVELLEIVR
ncbi:MAG: FKBP-type peptidyl-prolyl cis-trans isomerase [Bacteroidales bacterium]|nr:FKBP-type peptidyl-prolyl cis-trans isomerase [Bacteroidales bacterium]